MGFFRNSRNSSATPFEAFRKFGALRSIATLATAIFLWNIVSIVALAPNASAQDGLSKPIGDKWALVVGISKFADPSIALNFAAKDAQDFANYLTKEARFAPDHVRTLLDEEATRENILAELGDKWLPRVAQPDDLVVIYISSHGSPSTVDVEGLNYLVAHNTNKNSLYATGIPIQELSRIIKQRVHAERVIVILDACHSGAAKTAEKGLIRKGNYDADEIMSGTGQLVICSSAPSEVSWEGKGYQNSVFTKHLIESLKLRGEYTKLGEAYNNLKGQVQSEVLRDRGELQNPQLKSKWQGNDLMLACRPARPRAGIPKEPTISYGAPSSYPNSSAGTAGLPSTSNNATTIAMQPGAPTVEAGAIAGSNIKLQSRVAVLPVIGPQEIVLDEIWTGLDAKGDIKVKSSPEVANMGQAVRECMMTRLKKQIAGTELFEYNPGPELLAAYAQKSPPLGAVPPSQWLTLARDSQALYLLQITIQTLQIRTSYQSDELISKVSAKVVTGDTGEVLWQVKDRRISHVPLTDQSPAILSMIKNFLAPRIAGDLSKDIARAIKGK